MKVRDVTLTVTDHAVLRYLERRHGMDVEAIRQHLAGLAVNAARLGAVSVQSDRVRLLLRDNPSFRGRAQVSVVTVVTTDMHGAPGGDRDG